MIHRHYRRILAYDAKSTIDDVGIDSRQKWLLRLPSPLPQALIDPGLWARLGPSVLPSIVKRLPTPCIYLQEGPTCGMYAMKMIAPHLNVDSLLAHAREANFTRNGEMFCAGEWAELAQTFGLRCEVTIVNEIAETLLRHPEAVAVVPYDADMSGISFRAGRNAHWCVVWSVWQVEDEIIALITHSSGTLPCIERWCELEQSNRQLEWATVRVNPEIVEHISCECLNGRGVVVW